LFELQDQMAQSGHHAKVSELISYINNVKSNSIAQISVLDYNDLKLSSRTGLVPGSQRVSDRRGELRRVMAHRVLHHIDITSISFLVLSYFLALARTKTNTSGVHRRLTANKWT
jgi:hypothetical protein